MDISWIALMLGFVVYVLTAVIPDVDLDRIFAGMD